MKLETLLAENIGLILILALTLFATLSFLASRHLVRLVLGEERNRWAVIRALALVIVSTGGLLFFGSGIVAIGPGLIEQARLTGSPAPELNYLRLEDQRAASLADHRGKVVLVNIWATWCPPCRAEMPALEQLQQTYAQDGLVVLNISDETRERIASYLESQPMSTEHAYVEEIPWPTPGRPTSYVIDREGVLRKSILGERDFETFESLVQKYL